MKCAYFYKAIIENLFRINIKDQICNNENAVLGKIEVMNLQQISKNIFFLFGKRTAL